MFWPIIFFGDRYTSLSAESQKISLQQFVLNYIYRWTGGQQVFGPLGALSSLLIELLENMISWITFVNFLGKRLKMGFSFFPLTIWIMKMD